MRSIGFEEKIDLIDGARYASYRMMLQKFIKIKLAKHLSQK